MKIDFYISSLSSGGAERVLTYLATDFANKNHDVSITSFEKRPQFYDIDPAVILNKCDNTQKNKITSVFADFFGMCRYIRQRKADVAISFLSRSNIMLVLACLFSKTKTIVCDRNNLLRKYPKIVFMASCFVYAFANAVCVQTNEIKKYYPKYLQKKIFVLENPLDFDAMDKQLEGEELQKEKTVLSVGRLEDQKDFVTLIYAFERISAGYPEWKLKIFGQGKNEQILAELINELDLNNRVFLCGVTHKPFLEMKRAKIFVLSSFYEGFPNVLCEAMHAGLACISTNCECGPAELIENGENGFLVPVGDTDAMAEKIRFLIENETVRAEMGQKAIKATDRLELSTICDGWIEMVKKIANME